MRQGSTEADDSKTSRMNGTAEARAPSFLFMTHAGDPGGAEFKMLALCKALGPSAHVLLLHHGRLEAMLAAQGTPCVVAPLDAEAGAVRRDGGLGNLVRAAPGSLRLVKRIAREARPHDVVVCFSQKAFVLASLSKPFMRRPIVWFMNDILSRDHFSPLLIRLLIALSRYSADRIAVVSEESLREWLRAGGRPDGISVVHSGIDLDEVSRQTADLARIAAYRREFSPDGAPLIGMFGRVSSWKGQDIFLRAMAQIPDARGVIAGGALFDEQDYERELRALARELGVEDRVAFTGHVDDPMTLMSACDVVAHCSTAPEPSGRVIVEAMFAGTPVIGSDAGGVREFILPGETGLLTPMKDVDALVAAIRRYLGEPVWAKQVASHARQHAHANYSSRATVAGFQRAVSGLAGYSP
jgi:glycosyltransferase involved in cell wall biosynthesis